MGSKTPRCEQCRAKEGAKADLEGHWFCSSTCRRVWERHQSAPMRYHVDTYDLRYRSANDSEEMMSG
jgi:hypothetical protein